MNECPNIYDWDDDDEHADAGMRLRKHLHDAEWLLNHEDMRDPENQEVIRKEITYLEDQLVPWSASRARRTDFRRRGVIPK